MQPGKILQVSNWFETNHMFAYPDKFQAIAVHHNKNINENYTLKVNNTEFVPNIFVKLLGLEIDNELLFDKYVASLRKKAANQIHAICRLQNPINKKEKVILKNSFVYSNFNIALLSGIFVLKN